MKNFITKNNVSPKLSMLSEEQIIKLHKNSITVLENTGVKVECKDALQIFSGSDGVIVNDDVVNISGELINYCIEKAPSDIEIFNRSGDAAFALGQKQFDETYFGIGVTNTYYQDIEGSKIELFNRKHMQSCTKLGDLLENYDMISTLGIPSSVPVEKSDLYSTLDMYANTVKPLVLLISGENRINEILELLKFLHDDISSKPFCLFYVNPITPLVMNKATTDKMIGSISNKIPVIYSNYSMYGGTSPIIPASTLVLLNSELLAGLVFSQLIDEGSKIILGSLPAAFNMINMGSIYTPTSYLLNLACAEMMHYYKIPHCGTSGSGIGRGADLQASGDLWLNHLISCIGKIGCVPFVGGNFDSTAFSPTTAVLSNHIIGKAKKFAKGFSFNDDLVNLNEINRIGHGGDYFTSDQTLNFINELNPQNDIWTSLSLEEWQNRNKISPEKDLIDYTLELYSKAEKESEENLGLIKKGEEFIESIKF